MMIAVVLAVLCASPLLVQGQADVWAGVQTCKPRTLGEGQPCWPQADPALDCCETGFECRTLVAATWATSGCSEKVCPTDNKPTAYNIGKMQVHLCRKAPFVPKLTAADRRAGDESTLATIEADGLHGSQRRLAQVGPGYPRPRCGVTATTIGNLRCGDSSDCPPGQKCWDTENTEGSSPYLCSTFFKPATRYYGTCSGKSCFARVAVTECTATVPVEVCNSRLQIGGACCLGSKLNDVCGRGFGVCQSISGKLTCSGCNEEHQPCCPGTSVGTPCGEFSLSNSGGYDADVCDYTHAGALPTCAPCASAALGIFNVGGPCCAGVKVGDPCDFEHLHPGFDAYCKASPIPGNNPRCVACGGAPGSTCCPKSVQVDGSCFTFATGPLLCDRKTNKCTNTKAPQSG